MRVLVTTDTAGGVWTFTRELVPGLMQRGLQVTLVSFGGLPSPEQTRWMDELPDLDYRPTCFMLEWMQDCHESVAASQLYLEAVVAEVHPDLLHLNQFCYGDLPVDVPCIVTGHSDVVSWWRAVHGQTPPEKCWLSWYRDTVQKGLRSATVVTAPSQWMLSALSEEYGPFHYSKVVHNGRDPRRFCPTDRKENCVLCVGRLWDEGKNVSLLTRCRVSVPINLVGWARSPDCVASTSLPTLPEGTLRLLGSKSEDELAALYSFSSVYCATSRYEPFGLAPLEAAFSGCALVLSDIATFRELWGDAAVFFHNNDAESLQACIEKMASDPHLRRQYASLAHQHARKNFTSRRMVDDYLALYSQIRSAGAAAA